MNNYPYVYRLTHKETGQFYIGYRQANSLPAELDLGIKYKSSSKIVAGIGYDNFLSEIILEFRHEDRNIAGDMAYEYENSLIKDSLVNPLCLNQHFRENGLAKFKPKTHHSEETKAKIGKAQIGKIIPQESRDKMSKAGLGRIMSDEARANMSASGLGRIMSDEAKIKMSESKMGHEVTPEAREKLRLANVGKVVPDDVRARISETTKIEYHKRLKTYSLTSPDGIIYTGIHLTDFCREHDLKLPSVSALCSGSLERYKGWTGKYIKEQYV